MSKIRLSNDDRGNIKNSLIENHFKKNIQPLLDKASELASKLMLECYPPDVLKFHKEHPEFTNIDSTSVYVYNFVKDGAFHYCDRTTIKVDNVSSGLGKQLKDYSDIGVKSILSKNKEFISLCTEAYNISMKEIELKGKLTCILDRITTVKRLKEEFPEGYRAYYQIPPEDSLTGSCDDIEKVRAELNSNSKESLDK